MTRDEYRAQKAAKERMRRTEQKHKQAAKGSMDIPFLILTLLLTVVGLIMLFFSAVLYMKVIGPQYEKNRLR